MARSSMTEETSLDRVSTSGVSPGTFTVSPGPATLSANSSSSAPPTSTVTAPRTCRAIPVASTRMT